MTMHPCDCGDPECGECGECSWCTGDGVQDDHEEDPINSPPGTWVACPSCGGTGRAKDQTVW